MKKICILGLGYIGLPTARNLIKIKWKRIMADVEKVSA